MTTPIFAVAYMNVSQSGMLRAHTPKWSPGRMPMARSPRARLSVRSSKSRYVQRSARSGYTTNSWSGPAATWSRKYAPMVFSECSG